MHSHSTDTWRHGHVFLGADHKRNERRTWLVIGLTTIMMVGEIAAGWYFGSMALLADGWHMFTHAGALLISAGAYVYARRHASDERFAFGTGKVGDLAAFASAVVLAVIAVLIGFESFVRLSAPVPVAYGEATAVAVLGLAVNLVSAWLLHDGGGHGHHHHHGHHDDQHHDDHHHHHDHNLRSAYLHVVADTLTSVLAIGGLLAAWSYGWLWIDPLVGILGAAVIARWSLGLLRQSGAVLVDTVPDDATRQAISRALEVDGDRISDLHLWRVGPGHLAAIVALVSDHPRSPEHYKARLASIPALSHVTVEVHRCEDHRRRAA